MISALCAAYISIMVEAAVKHFPDFDNRTLALAQMEQESSCRPNVTARDGGMGLMQFMPRTLKWVVDSGMCPLGSPYNPAWAADCGMALVRYGWDNMPEYTPDNERYYAGLATYNYGRGWVNRDNRVCRRTPGCDASKYLGHVQLSNDTRRAVWARKYGRTYVPHILRRAKKYSRVVYG